MAEEKGNDAVWNHIVDLHRKHSELQMQMHDKGGEDGMQEMHAAVVELTSAVKALTAVMKSDTQADKGESKVDKAENGTGRRKQPSA